jgi:SpoVK/Ycf46/Vps4 family AAA+-type ATPase
LFAYYLGPAMRPGIDGLGALDVPELAEQTPLYTPADIKAVAEAALRAAIYRTNDGTPRLLMDDLVSVLATHQRAIRPEAAAAWIEESRQELGPTDVSLVQLEAEVRLVYGS